MTEKRRVALIYLLSVLVGLLMAELYVRYFSVDVYLSPAELRDQRAVEYETAVFARSVIKEKEKIIITHKGIKIFINKLGYRGREFSPEKRPDTIRIMIYGGSQVFQASANEFENWVYLLENDLRQHVSPKIEVINAGVPGHASFDSVGRLFAEGHLFSPDYVLLDNGWNDIKTFTSDKPLLRTVKPSEPWKDPRLYYRFPGDRFLSEKSEIYGRIRQKFVNWYVKAGNEDKIVGEFEEPKESSKVYLISLKQYKLNISTFVDVARSAGAIPIIIIQPRLVSRSNTEKDKKKIRYGYVGLSHDQLLDVYDEIDQIIREVAQTKSVRIIEANKEWRWRSEYFGDHVHLRPEGGASFAKFLSSELAKILDSDPRLKGFQ